MLRKIFEGILNGAASISYALVLLMPVAIIVDVLSRALFSKPLALVFEGTEYSMLWIPLLAAPLITRHNEHIIVDLIDGLYTKKHGGLIKNIVTISSASISLVFVLILAVMAWDSVTQSLAGNYVMQTTLAPPRWIIHAVIPFSMGLCAVVFAVLLAGALTKALKRGQLADVPTEREVRR